MSQFAVADCPACHAHFRLVWKLGGRKIAVSQRLRLSCPACGHRFETKAVELVVFGGGREAFPASAVVDLACLVGWRAPG